MHDVWLVELLRWLVPRLPKHYRAQLVTTPSAGLGIAGSWPDLAVRQWEPPAEAPEPHTAAGESLAPDDEVATLTLDPQKTLMVTGPGGLVAVLEIVSPRNKDRPSARATYLARYLAYLHDGANLFLIDLHRRPQGFSFADGITEALDSPHTPLEPPFVAAYRVGEPAATGGRYLADWRRQLAVGEPLPTLPLPLTVHAQVMIDLEQTYATAAQFNYLT